MASNSWMEELSILILSTQEFCQRLKLSMKSSSDKLYDREIKIKVAESIEDINLSPNSDTTVDYIVLVVDTQEIRSIDFCKKNLCWIQSNFLYMRMCIVNGSCRSSDIRKARELSNLAQSYNIPYLNGQVMDNSDCKLLSERIMKIAAVSTGFLHGMPTIIPTPKDLNL